MKLKTYAEIEQIHKEKFYKEWYDGLKDKVIEFIENNFMDIEGFNIELPYGLLYKFQEVERVWIFKFLRLELWDIGLNLMKSDGLNYILFKRNKNDKYSKFLNYPILGETFAYTTNSSNEIRYIQIITGKTYDEARKIFNAAINIKPKKEENKNIAINVANIATNVKEESAVPTDVTEAIEQTLATDDSE